MLHYTDLLILELKKFENPDVLRELLILTDKMTELAKDQKNALLEVQTSVIKANLYLLDGDLEMSTTLLEDLYEQTMELQLSNLANRVKSLQEEISQNMTNWDELITKNASLKDRIEQSSLDEYIRIALTTRNSSINVGE